MTSSYTHNGEELEVSRLQHWMLQYDDETMERLSAKFKILRFNKN